MSEYYKYTDTISHSKLLGVLMNITRIDDYWCYDRNEEPLKTTLLSMAEELIGLYAVNTSFDSGLYRPDQVSEKLGERFISEKITKSMLAKWPLSHDDFCDEWYFFNSVPDSFETNAYCNYMSRIGNWKELEFEGGCGLQASLRRYNPLFVIGNNEFTYVISSKNLAWNAT